MDNVARQVKWLGAVALFALFCNSALADELTANSDEYLLNGDAVTNGAVLNGAWQTSFASSIMNELGVMDRGRPDYTAKGLPLGGFRLYPTLGLAAGYDSNVYFTSKASGDGFAVVSPSLNLQSDWGRDSLSVYGGAESTFYQKDTSQNFTNWDVGASGRADILGDSDLRANVFYDGLSQPLSSPNTVGNAAKPTTFDLFHGDAAFDTKPNRLGLTVGASYDRYDYQKTPLVGGGDEDNSAANEGILTAYGRVSYDFSPGYSAFIGGSYDNRHFQETYDVFGYDRDSDGYQAVGGTQFFITHLIQGQIYGGYGSQTFDKGVLLKLPNVSYLDYGANINWYVTPLLTVHLDASRTIDDTVLAGASASDDQTIWGGFDYELLRDLLFQVQGGYLHQKFVGLTRSDDVPTASVGLTWLINHNFSVNAHYFYNDRTSNEPGLGYSQNTFMLGLKAQL
jgi:hypothetical protein